MLAFQVYTSGSYQKLKKKNKDAALFNWAISWTISAISRLLPFPDFSNMESESDLQLSFRDGAIIPSDHPNIIFHSINISKTDHPNIVPLSSPQYCPIWSPQHYHPFYHHHHKWQIIHYYHPNDIIITPILSHLITQILSSMKSSSQQLNIASIHTVCIRGKRIIFTVFNYHLKGNFFAATNNAWKLDWLKPARIDSAEKNGQKQLLMIFKCILLKYAKDLFFIGPESDHWEGLSLTDSLTD